MSPRLARIAALTCALAGHSCGAALAPPPVKSVDVAAIRALPPTLDELRNMTYAGLVERLGSVTLANGRWTGAPPAPGAASQPIVELADDFRVVGDLDGDGLDEVVVVLTAGRAGRPLCRFSQWPCAGTDLPQRGDDRTGDRVQVRSARISAGRLLVSVVRRINDAMCCRGSSTGSGRSATVG